MPPKKPVLVIGLVLVSVYLSVLETQQCAPDCYSRPTDNHSITVTVTGDMENINNPLLTEI